MVRLLFVFKMTEFIQRSFFINAIKKRKKAYLSVLIIKCNNGGYYVDDCLGQQYLLLQVFQCWLLGFFIHIDKHALELRTRKQYWESLEEIPNKESQYQR